MNCKNCGAEIDRQTRFCPSCGEPIQKEEPEIDITKPPKGGEYSSETNMTEDEVIDQKADQMADHLVGFFGWIVGTAFWIAIGIFIGWNMRQHKLEKDAEDVMRQMDNWGEEMNQQIEDGVHEWQQEVDDYINDYYE